MWTELNRNEAKMITETKSGTFVLVEEQKQSFKLPAYLYIWVPGLSNLYLNAEQT